MRKLMFLLTVLLSSSLAVNATTTTKTSDVVSDSFIRGYGNNFIFMEDGIEFFGVSRWAIRFLYA